MNHIRFDSVEATNQITTWLPITKRRVDTQKDTSSHVISQSITDTVSVSNAKCTVPRTHLRSSISLHAAPMRICTIIPNAAPSAPPSTRGTLLTLLDELDSRKTDCNPFLTEKGFEHIQKLPGTTECELFEAIDTKTKQKVTIKATPKAYIASKSAVKEANMQQHLTTYCSPLDNIPRFLSFFESSSTYYLVTEFAGNMTLLEFVHKMHGYLAQKRLPLKQWKQIIKCIFWQITVTVHWLHDVMKYCHLSLNMSNIMLSGDVFTVHRETGMVQIDPQIEIKLVNFSRTENFAHEINDDFLVNHYHASKSDVWQLGVMLYSMATGIMAQNPVGDKSALESIFLHRKQRFCGRKMIHLLSGMMNRTESERLHINKVLQHQWLRPYYLHYQQSVKKLKPQTHQNKMHRQRTQ